MESVSRWAQVLVTQSLMRCPRTLQRNFDRSGRFFIVGYDADIISRSERCLRTESLLLTRVIGRIDIRNREWSLTVYLDNRWSACPRIVIHFRRGFAVPTRSKFDSLFLIKFVAHSNMKITGYHSNVLRCRMILGGDLIAIRHFQAEHVRTIFEWI